MPDTVVVDTTNSGQPAAPAAQAPSSAPAADSAAPVAPASPEPAAPAGESAPVVVADSTPAAPSAPAGDSATPGATSAETRVANAQRMMHAATQARAELEKQLASLGVVPVTRQAAPGAQPGVVQPQVQPQVQAQPPVQAPPQPSPAASRQPLTIAPEVAKAIHTKYTGAGSDEEATAVLVQEVANLILQQIPTVESIVANREFMDRTYKDFNTRIRTETQQNERAASTIKTLDEYFAKHAPGVPAKLIWSYADEAVQAKPGNLTDQALYMLERALGEVGPLLGQASAAAQTTQALAQGQGAVLPGGSGLPAAGGVEGRPLTFVEQLQRSNQGI